MNITTMCASLDKATADLIAGSIDIQTAKVVASNAGSKVRLVATHVKYAGERAVHGDKMQRIEFFEVAETDTAKASVPVTAANDAKLKTAR